jgi:hypothetical protein
MLRFCSICFVALAMAAMPMDDAFAAKKKKKSTGFGGRDKYTSEQREAIHREATKLCNKRYGMGQVHRTVVNYASGTITCWIN